MMKTYDEIVALVRDTLVDAGSTFRPDKKEAYRNALPAERTAVHTSPMSPPRALIISTRASVTTNTPILSRLLRVFLESFFKIRILFMVVWAVGPPLHSIAQFDSVCPVA